MAHPFPGVGLLFNIDRGPSSYIPGGFPRATNLESQFHTFAGKFSTVHDLFHSWNSGWQGGLFGLIVGSTIYYT